MYEKEYEYFIDRLAELVVEYYVQDNSVIEEDSNENK